VVEEIERLKELKKSNKKHFEETLNRLETEKLHMERDYDYRLKDMSRIHTVELEKRSQDYNDKMEADQKRY
jgi:hypothetical protein